MALRINLRGLEIFTAIATRGGVTAAAAQLGLTQSAASQALANLEGSLGTTLFDRVAKRLIINEHGRVLLPQARAMLDQAHALQTMFQGERGLALRLGASTTIGNYLLAPLLASFKRQHPQAQIELLVANTAEVVEAVAGFTVDAGFIEGPSHHPELLATPWREDRLCVFAGKDHPLAKKRLSLEDMRAAHWVLREAGSGTRDEVERLLLPHLYSLDQVTAINQSEAIKHLVAAGIGISCLSWHAVAQMIKDGALVELQSPLPPLRRQLLRIQHKNKSLTKGLALALKMFD